MFTYRDICVFFFAIFVQMGSVVYTINSLSTYCYNVHFVPRQICVCERVYLRAGPYLDKVSS